MNLVNELQISAEKDDVLTVLRKTKRLASKLGRDDISAWLQHEQNGYPTNDLVPDYRRIRATLAFNTNGYIPAGFGHVMRGVQDLPSGDLDLRIPLSDPISGIMSLIGSHRGGNGLYQGIAPELDAVIRRMYHFNPMVSQQITLLLHMNEAQMEAIPDQIKDRVLTWACDLERAGVTGDGMTFSPEEKQIAHSITFNISNSQIDQLNNMGMNQRGDK